MEAAQGLASSSDVTEEGGLSKAPISARTQTRRTSSVRVHGGAGAGLSVLQNLTRADPAETGTRAWSFKYSDTHQI